MAGNFQPKNGGTVANNRPVGSAGQKNTDGSERMNAIERRMRKMNQDRGKK